MVPDQLDLPHHLSLTFVQQYNAGFYDEDDPMAMYQAAMLRRGGPPPRRFDEYYRCYPIAMMPGPDRESANHGGKIFLPASALDKLTRLHITYPMLFELLNGAKERTTHAGVLEFIAEEGKIYLPYWLMQTLLLEPGDLLQVKSTDLPLGSFIKLQPQDSSFLDISDPKAVLENAFRNFSCLTKGDIFTFAYNDSVYSIAVLEVKPDDPQKHAICTLETDLSVDFAPPVGYEEPSRTGTNTPLSSAAGKSAGKLTPGHIQPHGTMGQAINYAAIAPSSGSAAAGARATSSNFGTQGHRLSAKKGVSGKAPTPKPSTPVQGASINQPANSSTRRENGPLPLRLPPGKLFFGYEIKPIKGKQSADDHDDTQAKFQGPGQSLRKKKGGESGSASGTSTPR
ncbi:MAG: ubiquitin fusion degradation protein [Bathelium mastoideum]|nr:MAG: ubiquitin fusion degradation protein [Bathelium mastoideum]KAI9687545.1 MAG: ubiquitin fusion degradation protein [Bathelium mastoideum]